MIKLTLTKRVEYSLMALETAKPLIEIIEALDAENNQLDASLLRIAEGGPTKIQDGANSIHSQLANLPRITRKLSARTIFREVESLEANLSTALDDEAGEFSYAFQLRSQLDAFAEIYNTYVGNQAGVNALPLLKISHSLRQSIGDFFNFLIYIRSTTSDLETIKTDETKFYLHLPNIIGLHDFANRLSALEDLYLELCYILEVSSASHPLRIAKIESGSLLTWLFGETRVIGLMVSFLENSVRFLYRNYTNEGKIAEIPKTIESLDKILDYTNRLKESGVDVSDVHEVLAKNAFVVASSLNKVLANQPVVEINEKVISIGQEVQQSLLNNANTPKIEFTSLTGKISNLLIEK